MPFNATKCTIFFHCQRGFSFYYPLFLSFLSAADDLKIGLFGKVQFLCIENQKKQDTTFFSGGGQMQFNASAITEVQEVLDYRDDQVQKKFSDPSNFGTTILIIEIPIIEELLLQMHILHYSKLRKNVRVTQSQNVPSSSLSQPVADRQAEAG